jgi:hypothetical protein
VSRLRCGDSGSIAELPIEDGELIVRALDCAVAGGEVTTDVDPDAVAESKGTAWRAQQADALVAVARSYLDGGEHARYRRPCGERSTRAIAAARSPVVISSATSMGITCSIGSTAARRTPTI